MTEDLSISKCFAWLKGKIGMISIFIPKICKKILEKRDPKKEKLKMMKTKKWKTAILFVSCFTGSLFAAEVDSFTYRNIPLQDSLELANTKTNEYLSLAVKEANEREHHCEEKVLYKRMRKYFNNQYQGELGEYLVKAPGFDKHTMTIEESIYADFKWYQSVVQGFFGRVFEDPTAATIKINGVMMGTDKFEHFLGSGFRYFESHHVKGQALKEALAIGERAETGVLGAITTGVMSYGDLAANFNGMRFWNHVLQKRDDVLGENIGPYVSCDQGRFKVEKEISWASYVDHSFDESVNCSAFTSEKMLLSVKERLRTLEAEYDMSLECPVLPNALQNVKEKYQKVAPSIINDQGHYSLRGESEKSWLKVSK